MMDSSATRNVGRLTVITDPNGKVKVKCGEPGRSKGKKCGSTLLIDNKIACQAGHEFALGELLKEICLTSNPLAGCYLGDALKWLADLFTTVDDQTEQGKAVVEKFLSPPFTVNPSYEDKLWFTLFPFGYQLLLTIIDRYHLLDHEIALQKQVINTLPPNLKSTNKIRQAMKELVGRAEGGSFESRVKCRHLIESYLRLCGLSGMGQKRMLMHYLLRYDLELRANQILNITAPAESSLIKDSLQEAQCCLNTNLPSPVLFQNTDDDISEIRYVILSSSPESHQHIVVRTQGTDYCFFEGDKKKLTNLYRILKAYTSSHPGVDVLGNSLHCRSLFDEKQKKLSVEERVLIMIRTLRKIIGHQKLTNEI